MGADPVSAIANAVGGIAGVVGNLAGKRNQAMVLEQQRTNDRMAGIIAIKQAQQAQQQTKITEQAKNQRTLMIVFLVLFVGLIIGVIAYKKM